MKIKIYDATNDADRNPRPALSVTWIMLRTEDDKQLSGLGLREYQM